MQTDQPDCLCLIGNLKEAVRALSLEAPEQLRLFPDFAVPTDELIGDFYNWYEAAKGNCSESFTKDEFDCLRAIDLYIDTIPVGPPEQSVTEELRTSPHWKELRRMALVALSVMK